MILFGNRVTTDAVKLRILRGDHTGSKWVLNPVTGVLILERRLDTEVLREEGHGRQAEIGAGRLQAKESRGLPATPGAERGMGQSPSEPQGESGTNSSSPLVSDLWFPEL